MFTSTIIFLVAAAVVAGIVFYGFISDRRDDRANRQESPKLKDCLEMCLSDGQHSAGACSSMCAIGWP
jgi:hypothetical protein